MAAAHCDSRSSNPSHYQTMFSGVLTDWNRLSRPRQRHAEAAFNVLLDDHPHASSRSIASGLAIRSTCAEITWALSHGVATLGPGGPAARARRDRFRPGGARLRHPRARAADKVVPFRSRPPATLGVDETRLSMLLAGVRVPTLPCGDRHRPDRRRAQRAGCAPGRAAHRQRRRHHARARRRC